MFSGIKEWWSGSHKDTKGSILAKLQEMTNNCHALEISEYRYRKLLETKLKHEKVLEVMITISNAIAVCALDKKSVKATVEILHDVFDISEVYYAERIGNIVNKKNTFINKNIIDTYTSIKEVSIDSLPELVMCIENNECYTVNNNKFMESQEKEYYNRNNIKAITVCPVQVDGIVVGFVGFNSINSIYWSPEELTLCKIISSLLSTALWIEKQKVCTAPKVQ